MTKPFNSLELVARVKSQLRRYTKLGTMMQEPTSNVYKTGGLEINDDMKQVTVDGIVVEKLTPIQYNILLFLTKNKGRVFSIEQIYENIWRIIQWRYISGISGKKSKLTLRNHVI